jgi:hypothetical protein
MGTNHSMKNEVTRPPARSVESFQTVLTRWLVTFGEHYRQPLSEVSVACYRDNLSDLNPEELDAACRRALWTSEFMPTVATIRNALRSSETTPRTLIQYPEVSPAEREISPELQKAVDDLKQKLRVDEPVKKSQSVKKITPMSSPRPIEEQKAELRRRGWLK